MNQHRLNAKLPLRADATGEGALSAGFSETLAVRTFVLCFLSAWIALMAGGQNVCQAAEKAKIQESIRKAQGFLLKPKLSRAEGTLAALALVKSGSDRDALAIREVLREVLAKVQEGTYNPAQHHVYEAAVDLMFLEAMDPKLYRPQMEAATTYIVTSQRPNGAWFYPHGVEVDSGDTSITQYALIGLWAATRVGIEVPTEVWENAVSWQVSKLQPDGGFCYHPFESKSQQSPELRMTTCTMTGAGASSLLIARRVLFVDVAFENDVKPAVAKRRFGVLESFVDEKVTVKRQTKLRPTQIDDTLKDSIRWMTVHFGEKASKHQALFTYDLYCIERVSALLDIESFGTHDWYNEGADELLLKQAADGSWNDECGQLASTALGLMFLTKVTATVIKPVKKAAMLGGGLQAGGRGLPDNLNAVQVKEGNVSSRKIVGAVDNLLIELERSSDAKVEDVQKAVVDAVQLDHPEQLIGQIPRLRKLAVDARLEVRRTAIWALGRSGDVSATPSLIRGLADRDLSVVREASLALSILSRRPEGCDLPVDPTDDSQMKIKAEATDEERRAIIEPWRAESIKRWTDWYQQNRPYEERDDRTTLKKTNK